MRVYEGGEIGGIVELPVFVVNCNTAQLGAFARAGSACADASDERSVVEIVDPDRSDSFVVDVEWRKEIADDERHVGIDEVIELKVVDAGKRDGVIWTSGAVFAKDELFERGARFDEPAIADGDRYNGADCGCE